jgi:hypothetical protein
MAITYDAPSTNWQTASEITAAPRVVYPIYQEQSAVVYEEDYVQNEDDFAPLALDTSMQSTTCDGATGTGSGALSVASTTGFPDAGKIQIDSEWITYTGKTSTTFTGIARSQGQGTETSSAADHTDGTTVYAAIWMVEESVPQQLGGSLIRWTRRFATVPDTWIDFEMRSTNFPGYYNDSTEANYRCPLVQNVIWKVTNRYYKNNDPYANIAVVDQKFQSKDSNGCPLDYVDGSSLPSYAAYTILVSASSLIDVSDCTLERYAGNLWLQKQFETAAK